MYAIETFGSTGEGNVVEGEEISHYMRNYDLGHRPIKSPKSRSLLSTIQNYFSTLAFCPRWLDRIGETYYEE